MAPPCMETIVARRFSATVATSKLKTTGPIHGFHCSYCPTVSQNSNHDGISNIIYCHKIFLFTHGINKNIIIYGKKNVKMRLIILILTDFLTIVKRK